MATTVPESQPRSVASILLAIISIGWCGVVEGAILVSRQRFLRLIEEFELDMPVVTRLAIGPFVPILLAAVIVGAVIKELLPGFRQVRDWCSFAILLIGAMCFAVYLIGVFTPLMKLIDSLSG